MTRLRPRRAALRTWLPALLLLVLLIVLASLQIRWLEQMRLADAERTQADLEARLQRVADDFNRELGRLFVELQPLHQFSSERSPERSPERSSERSPVAHGDLPHWLSALLADWRQTSDYPELVESAYLIRPEGLAGKAGQAQARKGQDAVWQLEPPERLDVDELPSSLRKAALAFVRYGEPDRSLDRRGERGERGETGPNLVISKPPTVLVPLLLPPSRFLERGDGGEREGQRARRRSWRRGRFLLVGIVLDRSVLEGELLHDLIERSFGSRPGYRLRLVDKESGDPLTTFGPPVPGGASTDARVELLGPIAFDRGGLRRGRGGPRLPFGGIENGHWWLEASHPAGSLSRAIEIAHRRNLAVSLGILAILAAALVLLARGAARSRRLARQQLDFVAGITHELMTPLAALRSAGQNLADGVVSETPQIERYGRMIDREGQRLSELVGQVLAFSRMQAGRPTFHRQPLDAAAELGAVLEQMRSTLENAGVELEVRKPKSGLPVLADRQALRRALSNLISNAVKYGQPDGRSGAQRPWIGCSVERRGDGVAFEIADRGPGIAARDRPHLFEPFYRGHGLAAGNVPGSGLGLALVRHLIEGQGGRVELRPFQPGSENPGTAFRLILPAAPNDPAPNDPAPNDPAPI